MIDRYAALVAHADTGLGLDEFEGPARFTRPTDKRMPPVSTAKHQTEGNNPNPKTGQDQ